MKKCVICLILTAGLLSGCGAAQTYETVDDEWLQSVMAPVGELSFHLPDSAAQTVVQSGSGDRLYLCDGYTLTVQTLSGGDTDASIRSLCGYDPDKLTVIQTRQEGFKRYDWVWTSVGEGGDQMGRAVMLDDGSYHYCLCVMADAGDASRLQQEWEAVFSSVSLKA